MQIEMGQYLEMGSMTDKNWRRVRAMGLFEFRSGQRAAKEHKLSKAAGQDIELVVPVNCQFVEKDFVKGMFATLLKKQGYHETIKWLKVVGEQVESTIKEHLSEVAIEQESRAKKREAEKNKPDANWSDARSLMVPDISTELKLEEDWTFPLHYESRNEGLIQCVRDDFDRRDLWGHRGHSKPGPIETTLTAGTILRVSRIYIRQGSGMAKFSSLTFNIVKGQGAVRWRKGVKGLGEHDFRKRGERFWAKLADVNTMKCRVNLDSLGRD